MVVVNLKHRIKTKMKKKNVYNEMKKEIKRIKDLQQFEEPYENEAYREPLSIDTEIVKTILLSWGGPSDGFKLYFSDSKNLLRGVYFIADRGTYEETRLSDEEADLVYNFYMGGYFE